MSSSLPLARRTLIESLLNTSSQLQDLSTLSRRQSLVNSRMSMKQDIEVWSLWTVCHDSPVTRQ
eukprot:5387658-Amphidinium_carterae.1